MKASRIWMLGFVLTGALIGAAVFAQTSPQGFGTGNGANQSPDLGQNYARWSQGVQARSQTAQLVQQYIKSDKEDEKKEIRKKLSEALGKEFDAHIQQQQKELEDLEKQIEKLRRLVKKRLDSKATIVERRLDQLVQDAEGLGWNAPGAPSGWGMTRSPQEPYFRSSAAPKQAP